MPSQCLSCQTSRYLLITHGISLQAGQVTWPVSDILAICSGSKAWRCLAGYYLRSSLLVSMN